MYICTLCGFSLVEWAHIKDFSAFRSELNLSRRLTGGPDETQNLAPLCPLCHTQFDSGFVTIHPSFRIFVFSLFPSAKNLLRRFDYAYPRGTDLHEIPQPYIDHKNQFGFLYRQGRGEFGYRFPVQPPPRYIHGSYTCSTDPRGLDEILDA